MLGLLKLLLVINYNYREVLSNRLSNNINHTCLWISNLKTFIINFVAYHTQRSFLFNHNAIIFILNIILQKQYNFIVIIIVYYYSVLFLKQSNMRLRYRKYSVSQLTGRWECQTLGPRNISTLKGLRPNQIPYFYC